jgi:ATP-dependent Clp protease protease subunit
MKYLINMLEDNNSNMNKGDFGYMKKRLLKMRTILIFGEINKEISESVTADLLDLSFESSKPINIIISSQGGHVESGDTIHDMIKFVNNQVNIIGTGWVASAGLLIYLAAEKEHRFSLQNTRFLLHQPAGGMGGVVSDMQIQAEEMIKTKKRLNRIVANATGQRLQKIEEDAERDYWLNANEAKEYGIVKKIINSIEEVEMWNTITNN